MEHFEGFDSILQEWYKENKRQLPWRETTNPYIIWLSEIILQQTRIDQGTSYFIRFLEKYPTIGELAAASEDEVLKLWQGLGYYSRARNLHITAKSIVKNHDGQFPSDYKELLNLKGVGEYTAAAIASISFNQHHAVVDGNVYRVLARLFGISTPIDSTEGKKVFKKRANELLNEEVPGDHNQAMMEFGALQCIPKNPDCSACPFHDHCIALRENLVGQLPAKKGFIRIKHRYFNYLLFDKDDRTYIIKRTENDIWKNLYEFPMVETHEKTTVDQLFSTANQPFNEKSSIITEVTEWKKQVLSHQHIHYRFIYIQLKNKKHLPTDLIEVNKKDIFNFAVPKPIEKQLVKLGWF